MLQGKKVAPGGYFPPTTLYFHEIVVPEIETSGMNAILADAVGEMTKKGVPDANLGSVLLPVDPCEPPAFSTNPRTRLVFVVKPNAIVPSALYTSKPPAMIFTPRYPCEHGVRY